MTDSRGDDGGRGFRRPIRILTGDDVRAVLPMADCIEAMERALREHAEGDVVMPVRLVLDTRGDAGALALMPANLARSNLLGYKAVTVFPKTDPRQEPTHQAAIAVLEPSTGRMVGLVDGTSITEIRTAAVSAVATRYMAARDASVLAVLGAGAQAEAHLGAIGHVRPVREIRVWSRNPERAAALAGRVAHDQGIGVQVVAVASVRDALDGADVVVTATSSREPLLRRAWVGPGIHINAVGSCIPIARELDGETVAASRVIVDSRDAALKEAGDLLLAMSDGLIGPDHISGELGEVIVGHLAGRTAPEEITLFESLGLGVEDVAAAALVLERAQARGLGTVVEL